MNKFILCIFLVFGCAGNEFIEVYDENTVFSSVECDNPYKWCEPQDEIACTYEEDCQ